jgi:hypothetical protein
MANKGHWISNDNNVWTADEIWKFCKKYRIDVEWPIVKPQLEPNKKFFSLTAIGSTPFAIVNETEEKAIFGSGAQNLGYEDYATAFDDTNAGYLFKLVSTSGGYRLRLITPDNTEYNIWGKPGYLNTQSVSGNCCFILGVSGQDGKQSSMNGEDIKNGAVWSIEYVEGMGFSLKNVGTGKYLKDAASAKYSEPTYFTFCTLKQKTTGIEDVKCKKEDARSGIFDLQGRRVAQPTKGLYIVNGRKVVLK